MHFTTLLIGCGLAVTIFGGFAFFVATYLIRETGSSASPAFFVIFAAVISITTLLLVKDRTNARLAREATSRSA